MTLKQRFGVPEEHELKKLNYKAKGGMAQNEYWTWAEIDKDGNQVSRIEEWEVMQNMTMKSGFEKYDMDGRLIDQQSEL